MLLLIAAEKQRRQRTRINDLFLSEGKYRRELYPKHLRFFAAGGRHVPIPPDCPPECDGSPHRERCFMAANRIGKTTAGAYELTLHLTGNYPDWWVGKRFDRAIRAWACGQSNKTVREIIQRELLGPVNAIGSGMIPGDLITHRTTKQGIAEATDTIYVKHVSGGTSSVQLKSYEEGATSYYGAAIDLGWADEEPPISLWTEMTVRTMSTNGMCLLTVTPIQGLSEVVLSFLPNGLPGTT
jgi:phage terminase large subunit-like protein